MVSKELDLLLRFLTVKNSGVSLKDDRHLLRVSEEEGVELASDVSWCDLDKFQVKPHSSRNLDSQGW